MHLRAGNEETLACFILACSYFAPDSSWNLNYLSVLIAFSSVHHPANWLSHSSFVPDFKMLLKKSSCHLPPSFFAQYFYWLNDDYTGKAGQQPVLVIHMLFVCLWVCFFLSSAACVFWESAWAVKVSFHPWPLSALNFNVPINWKLWWRLAYSVVSQIGNY